MRADGGVGRKFNFLRVYENDFQLVRVFFVKQRRDHRVQTDRFALPRCAGDEQVRDFGEVDHKHFVCDGFADGERQFHRRFLELLRVEQAAHRHRLRLLVRNLNAHRAFAGDGRDNSHAERGQAQGDVVFKRTDARNFNTFGGRYFVERDGRADGRLNLLYFHAERIKYLDDARVVRFHLVHVDVRLVGLVFVEQVERGELVAKEGLARVNGHAQIDSLADNFALCFDLIFRHFDGEVRFV